MKIKVGDLVILRNGDESRYVTFDTDPRFLKKGTVVSVNENTVDVETTNNKKTEINTYPVNDKRVMTFDEYIMRTKDISYHMACNAEMAKSMIKEGKI